MMNVCSARKLKMKILKDSEYEQSISIMYQNQNRNFDQRRKSDCQAKDDESIIEREKEMEVSVLRGSTVQECCIWYSSSRERGSEPVA